MKAARLDVDATSLTIEDVPEPTLRRGSVIVRIETAFVPHFVTKLVDGSGGYTTPPRPFTLGMDGIGTVESVADDVHGLTVGSKVYCDTYFEPRHVANRGQRAFLGNFGFGPPSLPLLSAWPDGVYAEKVVLPAECIIPVDPDPDVPASILCRLGWLGTAYAAFKKAAMRPGGAVAVLGAGGLLGSSTVVVALALGASRIYAIGRRKAALDALAAVDRRIVAVSDPGSVPPVDLVLSCIEGGDTSSLEALVPRVRRQGSVVIIGTLKAPLKVSPGFLLSNDVTVRGSLWFERSEIPELLRLAAAGVLRLGVFSAQTFPLARIGEALAATDERQNPLRHVAIDCR